MKADMLSTGERRVLLALGDGRGRSPAEILGDSDFKELVEVMNAVSWLQSKGLVEVEETVLTKVTLDEEGETYVEKDFPERRVLDRIAEDQEGSISMEELNRLMGKTMAGITVGWLKRKGWVDLDRSARPPVLRLTDEGRKAVGTRGADEEVLHFIHEMGEVELEDIADRKALEQLKLRKSVVRVREEVVRKVTITSKGMEMVRGGLEIKDEVTQLSPAMLKEGRWRDLTFRPYDVDTFVPRTKGGKMNLMTVVTRDIREIFLNMGFTEVEYDFIQPCFWCMDALFIPQDHSARDLQDTLYMKEPGTIEVDDKVAGIVRAVHETGGDTGSTGWGYKWSKRESERVVLRTHTTVNSIRYLAAHPEPQIKIFTVGRVFRNEAVTFKHLPEFQQIEGIVMEEGACFRMLVGLLKEFYSRMGFDSIRLRPSFYPYTEPSLDVDAKFKGEWMEMGGAGILRPEVTEPFGVKHPVLAWGLGLERLIMIRHGISDIRSLYVNDIDWMLKAPML